MEVQKSRRSGKFCKKNIANVRQEIALDRWKERKKATVAHDHGYILQEAPAPSNEVVIVNEDTDINTPLCKVHVYPIDSISGAVSFL